MLKPNNVFILSLKDYAVVSRVQLLQIPLTNTELKWFEPF